MSIENLYNTRARLIDYEKTKPAFIAFAHFKQNCSAMCFRIYVF